MRLFLVVLCLLASAFAQDELKYAKKRRTAAAGGACTATAPNKGGSVDNGSAGTATLSATIGALGDLIVGSAWCFSGCTAFAVTVGSQSATVDTTAITNTNTGNGRIWYIPSATVSGAQTITFTGTGAHVDIQVSYVDFAPSAGCSATFHLVSSLGTGSSTSANAPSITATAGDVEYAFTDVASSITTVNAPWTLGTIMATSTNADGYILSASGSATANNMTLGSANNWAGLLAAFTLH